MEQIPCVCVSVCLCSKAEFQVLTRASKEREGGREITGCGFPRTRLEPRLHCHSRRVRHRALPRGHRERRGVAGVNGARPPARRAGFPRPGTRHRGRAGGGESRESPARSPSGGRFPPRSIYSSTSSCRRNSPAALCILSSKILPETGDFHKFCEWQKCL